MEFILGLYGGEPVRNLAYCHGRKGGALVHIGAVDAPVTIADINAALEECVALKRRELHVLGWEWEMGVAGASMGVRRGGLMHRVARDRGVKLVMMQIPREVMEESGRDAADVRFFELAYLRVHVDRLRGRQRRVRIAEFVLPNLELIPPEVRDKVSGWREYMDYWAVDWDFRNDTFRQGFVAYRTRRDRSLPLRSDVHEFPAAGLYRVVVKVIDIFGNDTSQGFDVVV